MISDNDSGEEIIFNYATIKETLESAKTSSERQTIAQEPIDLEIILLGPRSRRPSGLRRSKRDRSLRFDKTRSEKSIDLREFDPFALNDVDDDDKMKGTNDDGIKSTLSESVAPSVDKEGNDGLRSEVTELTNRGKSDEQRSSENSRNKSKQKKSPTNNANLLDKMERRYRSNRAPKADDSLHIDYMDYF